MENLRMPASYATLPEVELPEIFGGGELGDALDSFTDNLHLDDFFFQGGILSISISLVPLLLFKVVASGNRFVENIYKHLLKQKKKLLGIQKLRELLMYY